MKYMNYLKKISLTLLGRTLCKWITSITGGTRAHWRVTNNIANGIDAASIDTRIATFLIDAGHFVRAFTVTDTLVPAIRG